MTLRRAAVALSAGALATAGLTALSTAPASAGPVNLSYSTPGTYSWTVPQGIDTVTLAVSGAQGGGNATYPGGEGAGVTATFRVSAGQVLFLQVGGAGSSSGGGSGGGGAPGWGEKSGYGGGGASRVVLASQPLVVAGGGGGAGGGAAGGASGAPGPGSFGRQDGHPGMPGTSVAAGSGGAAGQADDVLWCYYAGEAGGSGSGASGGSGGSGPILSGNFNNSGGGGGGGGYFGGGGGGSSSICYTDAQHFSDPFGGGGGGGSSYVSPSRLSGSITDGVSAGGGEIVLTYQDGVGPQAAPVVSPAPNAAGWNNTDVDVIWNWTDQASGIDPGRCQPKTTLYASLKKRISATCVDKSGTVGVAYQDVDLKIDKMPPEAAPTTGPQGVTWNWGDSMSGIDPSRCPATTPWAYETTATCFDIAGNSTTITMPRHG